MREDTVLITHFLCLLVFVQADRYRRQCKIWDKNLDSCKIQFPFFTEDDICFGVWSEWSPCSVTCGRGIRMRTRQCRCNRSTDHACADQEHVDEICVLQQCADGTRGTEFHGNNDNGEDTEHAETHDDDGSPETGDRKNGYFTDDGAADSDGRQQRRHNADWDSDNGRDSNGRGEDTRRRRFLDSDRERKASIDTNPDDANDADDDNEDNNQNNNSGNDNNKYDDNGDNNADTDASADNNQSRQKRRDGQEEDDDDNEEEDRDEENSEEERRKRRKRRRKRRRRRRRRRCGDSDSSSSSSSDSSSETSTCSTASDPSRSDDRVLGSKNGLSLVKNVRRQEKEKVKTRIRIYSSDLSGNKPTNESSSDVDKKDDMIAPVFED